MCAYSELHKQRKFTWQVCCQLHSKSPFWYIFGRFYLFFFCRTLVCMCCLGWEFWYLYILRILPSRRLHWRDFLLRHLCFECKWILLPSPPNPILYLTLDRFIKPHPPEQLPINCTHMGSALETYASCSAMCQKTRPSIQVGEMFCKSVLV